MTRPVRMTRPSGEPKTGGILVKLAPAQLKELDAYCDAQVFPPSRGEAMRRAMTLMLANKDKPKSGGKDEHHDGD